MPYTTEDGGRLNNFAVEPKMYRAEPATPTQKRNVTIVMVGGLVLAVVFVGVAVLVSNLG
ncbi:ssl1498 family light-harvesting-like protein [Oscillatoriales cyanobacterium LEGE 11467]|uniref:Ssl1498 family light-harvesting-like protein n=1 Tax=Zarconia navalis LEGE 11467 TaxID=1828826 RepID=A0A928VV65_9CYAN|nr:ssl1498 family light-harvesting-like protein [Zarconia navalis]MBE9039302.1 ssl1498 family light-harvesting-like protein [Zarconia navalis LEGE 11467]